MQPKELNERWELGARGYYCEVRTISGTWIADFNLPAVARAIVDSHNAMLATLDVLPETLEKAGRE